MIEAEATGAPKIGLALGSGSARGLAHVGVIQELCAMGVHPQIVCGTSVGSLVGGAYCSGHMEDLGNWFSGLSVRDVFRYLDVRAIARGGVGQAQAFVDQLRERYGSPNIEDLPIAYAAVATDLGNGQEIWLRQGDLWDSVRASSALPGLLAPARMDDRWLVDGGLVNPVPVSVCRALGAEIIIAVNLNDELSARQHIRAIRHSDAAEAPAEPGLLDRLASGLRDNAPSPIAQWFEAGQQAPQPLEPPGIFSVLSNSINIMQDRITRSRLAGEPADLLITPRLAHIGLLDFEAAAEAIAEGREAVQRNAALIRYTLGLDGR